MLQCFEQYIASTTKGFVMHNSEVPANLTKFLAMPFAYFETFEKKVK